jgi:hypothetical protein
MPMKRCRSTTPRALRTFSSPSRDVRQDEQAEGVCGQAVRGGDLDGGCSAFRVRQVQVVGSLTGADVVGTNGPARHVLEEQGGGALVGAQSVQAARVAPHAAARYRPGRRSSPECRGDAVGAAPAAGARTASHDA